MNKKISVIMVVHQITTSIFCFWATYIKGLSILEKYFKSGVRLGDLEQDVNG